MLIGEFWEALGAHADEKAADRRHMGELVRGAALRLYNLQLPKKHKIRDPRDFWLLPWDEDKRAKEKEENDRELERLEHLSDAERHETAQAFLLKIGWTTEE